MNRMAESQAAESWAGRGGRCTSEPRGEQCVFEVQPEVGSGVEVPPSGLDGTAHVKCLVLQGGQLMYRVVDCKKGLQVDTENTVQATACAATLLAA